MLDGVVLVHHQTQCSYKYVCTSCDLEGRTGAKTLNFGGVARTKQESNGCDVTVIELLKATDQPLGDITGGTEATHFSVFLAA